MSGCEIPGASIVSNAKDVQAGHPFLGMILTMAQMRCIELLILWRLCFASHPKEFVRRAIVRLSCVATARYQIRSMEMVRTGLRSCVAGRNENRVLMLCSLRYRHSIKVGVTVLREADRAWNMASTFTERQDKRPGRGSVKTLTVKLRSGTECEYALSSHIPGAIRQSREL